MPVDIDKDKAMLLVNPDALFRDAQNLLLKEMGFKVNLSTVSGTEAWSLIKNFDVGLIISAWDLHPDMSGLGLLKIVREDEKYSWIPFLLVVPQITKHQVVQAGQAGVTDILIRPYSRDAFKNKILQTLNPEDDPIRSENQKLINTGLRLMKKGRLLEALNTFQRILEINESAEIYYNLGYIKTAQSRYEEAIIAFRRATEINRTFALAYKMMGEVYAKLGRQSEAQQCLEQAADIFMEKAMDKKAEMTLKQVLEVNPNTPNVYNSLGIVFRRQGKYEDAVRMYRKALQVTPKDEHIHYNLAKSYLSLKMFSDASEILKKALEINSEFDEARNLLQAIEMGEGLG